jgi:hypothetical protein
MKMTRREFTTLAGSAVLLPLDFRFPPVPQELSKPGCVILDLEEHCGLPESLRGYEACLTSSGFHSVTSSVEGLPKLLEQTRQVVIPAAASMNDTLIRQLLSFLGNGGSVLLESGLAFAEPKVWSTQRRLVKSHFDLSIEPPVQLWPAIESHHCIPYVDYHWPMATKVRDFSRVVPFSAQGWEEIAQVQNMAAGVRRKVGRGAITVLGSPLGPALWAGDQQARRWLDKVLSVSNPF